MTQLRNTPSPGPVHLDQHTQQRLARPRAREALGVKIGPLLQPGPLNAITDVPRLRVGMTNRVENDHVAGTPSYSGTTDDEKPKLIRTGITAIGTPDIGDVPLFAGIEALSWSGEMTGAHFIAEGGQLTTPILLTGTQNVGSVYSGVSKATAAGLLKGANPGLAPLCCVAETYDRLSHPQSFALGDANVLAALKDMLESEQGRAIKEGNAGGGTPMCSFGLKGGTGTSSRVVPASDGGSFTVGVLVQANHGHPVNLSIDGVNVGRKLYEEGYTKPYYPSGQAPANPGIIGRDGEGSIIAVVATDAPLLPHQCKDLARRAGVGISRGGGGDMFLSGDIFIAFSTASPLSKPPPLQWGLIEPVSTYTLRATSNETLDVLFRAAADAAEEAVLNALCAAEEMVGFTGRAFRQLPLGRVKEILKEAGRG